MMHNNGWQGFIKLCLSAKDEHLLSELLEVFLTHEERASIETRYLIVQALLDNQKSQRDISRDLKVSISKITRGSNELKRVPPLLKQYLLDNLK